MHDHEYLLLEILEIRLLADAEPLQRLPDEVLVRRVYRQSIGQARLR